MQCNVRQDRARSPRRPFLAWIRARIQAFRDRLSWPVILTFACYSFLAMAAFSGVHQAVVVGCCYLGLAAMVFQAHKQP